MQTLDKKQIPRYDIQKENDVIFHIIPIEEIPPKYENSPHRHDFYEIIWFTSACNEILIDFSFYETDKNAVFFLTPERINKYNTSDKKGFLIVFSKDFSSKDITLFHSLFMSFYDKPFVQPNLDNISRLKLLLELMKSEFNQVNPDNNILRSYLISFLLNLQRSHHIDHTIKDVNRDRVVQFYQLIESNYKIEHKANFYADNLNLTTQQINRILKNHVGKTITQLLHQKIVTEAKCQMLLGEKSMKEIAYLLGFEDPAYFSRFIRRNTGSSPEFLKTKMFKKYK